MDAKTCQRVFCHLDDDIPITGAHSSLSDNADTFTTDGGATAATFLLGRSTFSDVRLRFLSDMTYRSR